MDMKATGVWTAHVQYLSTITIVKDHIRSCVCVWERWGVVGGGGETIAVLVREGSGTLVITIRLLGSAIESPSLENQGVVNVLCT